MSRRAGIVVAIGLGTTAAAARAGDELAPVRSITVGDFDGDGKPDVAVGLPDVNVGALKKAGEVRVYSGATGALIRKVSGRLAEQSFGSSIAAVGDADGDGATDLAITAPYGGDDPYIEIMSPKSGRSLSTKRSGQSLTLMWGNEICALGDGSGKTCVDLLVHWGAQKQWLVYNTGGAGTSGCVSDGGAAFGSHAFVVGDVNGDGKADVAITNWMSEVDGKANAGIAYVISSKHLARGPVDWSIVILKGDHKGAVLGMSVAAAGDWDGDGKGDVLVGTAAEDDTKGAWLARVLSGKDKSELWKATGTPGDWHVPAVALVGDADGDGKPDVAVGAGAASSAAGLVCVCSSKDGAVLWTVKGAAKENLGDQLLRFFDADADGVADVLVVAPGAALSGKKGNGYVRVLSGKTGATLTTINPLVAK